MDPYRTVADVPAHPSRSPLPALPRRRGIALRLVLLFTALAVLVWALIQLLDNGRSPAAPSVSVLIIVGVALVFVVAVVLKFRRLIGLARENADAVAMLAAGRIDEAIAAFESLIRRSGRAHQYRAQFVANLGVAHLRRGDVATALEHLTAALQSGWIAPGRNAQTYHLLLAALAQAHAAHGELPTAQRFLAQAHEHVPAGQGATLVLTDALINARAGAFADVATQTEANWSDAEGRLTPAQMRALRLVRAFALAQLDPAGTRAQEITALVQGARPSTRGEFDYLAAAWPAFRAFLVEHGFTGG